MAKKENYGNESISQLKGADRVRKRPSVIFGSDSIDGCEHAFFEILSNSVDEAREGYGNVINVTRFLDGSYEIEDFGRGVPLDYNEREKRYNWDLVYCELYAGGKYNNANGGDYNYSLGLNGLGACATQYSSEFMDVTSYRDGKKYYVHFERGVNKTKGKLIAEPYNGRRTGTIHRFKPDIEVFTDINIPLEYFYDILKRQAVANAGLKFVFKNETVHGKFESSEYYYENGISDYAKEIVGDTAFTQPYMIKTERTGRDREDLPDYKVRVEALFCFSNARPFIEYYHNSSWLELGGSPDKAARSAFVSAIDAYIKQAGKYQKNESRITFNDVADSLVLITNGFSTVTSYHNQTKKAITNKFVQDMMTEFLRSSLDVYFIENKQEADKIADQVLINKRSREQAEKTRISVKGTLKAEIGISNRVEKFRDCRSKNLDMRELYIVEGDSALGSCLQARNPEFQAIMPIRGKILNCLKADYAKIFASPIITDLLRVLGCGADVKVKGKAKDIPTFSIESLRWNKIIICTDADVDGFQIRTLVLTMLYRLTPELINQGYVYIAESPLYEIIHKDKSMFAYSDREKEQICAELEGKKYKIMRSKGLGENTKEMMAQTTMNPDTRRLIKILPEDAVLTAETFEMLLGDNLQARKDHIAEYGAQYLDMVDIS